MSVRLHSRYFSHYTKLHPRKPHGLESQSSHTKLQSQWVPATLFLQKCLRGTIHGEIAEYHPSLFPHVCLIPHHQSAWALPEKSHRAVGRMCVWRAAKCDLPPPTNSLVTFNPTSPHRNTLWQSSIGKRQNLF